MKLSFPFPNRHIIYELRGGFLITPIVMVLSLALLGDGLCELELRNHAVHQWAAGVSWMAKEPGAAQLLLAAIAGSAMTVVAVVYSILLMTLTFASMQFSPRILVGFVRDSISQITLGMFLGTFAYCLVVLPRLHLQPFPFVPRIAVSVGLVLAVSSLAFLMYFIHHIALAIQANNIVERIAKDARTVLDYTFKSNLNGNVINDTQLLSPPDSAVVVSIRGGYVQYIDCRKLVRIAQHLNATIFIKRNVGQFLPPQIPVLSIYPPDRVTAEIRKLCLKTIHLGPVRTMEDDPEFGFLQIVDIALKAISPAINDPSTAIGCIDQLSGLLVMAATRIPPSSQLTDRNGKLRLVQRQTTFPRLLEIAYNQIIPYGRTDMAVSLRLMRALSDIATITKYPSHLLAIREMAHRVSKGCSTSFSEAECKELVERLEVIEGRTT